MSTKNSEMFPTTKILLKMQRQKFHTDVFLFVSFSKNCINFKQFSVILNLSIIILFKLQNLCDFKKMI